METIHKIGRRKRSIARIYLQEGKGEITVNSKKSDDYFTTEQQNYKLKQAFYLTNNEDKYDVKVNVLGGGKSGQVEAIRLALARAMCEIEPENRLLLKPEGLLMRDPRQVERKKYGRKKARKQFQFSKR
ncbi:MAG: 30S ribosomal protein S9 [Psychroflexus sp.]|jgi:small subunit ribosomal protein S9|nr:30S ribosomal protein S9 [Psychroflexus sp.]MDR9448635.1 30S ribosomal protein S9 [Psychroflexus sp.]